MIVIPIGVIALIISAFIYAKSRRGVNSALQEIVEAKEAEKVVQELSKFATKELEIHENSDGLTTLVFTLRNHSLLEDRVHSFAAKATWGKQVLALNIVMDMMPVEKEGARFHSFTLSRAGKQSDAFVNFLAELWKLEFPKKLTHKREVFGRALDFTNEYEFTRNTVADFQFDFTKQQAGGDATIRIQIDWNQGELKLAEVDTAYRKGIIEALKNKW